MQNKGLEFQIRNLPRYIEVGEDELGEFLDPIQQWARPYNSDILYKLVIMPAIGREGWVVQYENALRERIASIGSHMLISIEKDLVDAIRNIRSIIDAYIRE